MKKLFLIAILIGVVGIVVYRIAPERIQLPDGSTLTVASIQYGQTNSFLRGNLIERISDGIIPTNGMTLFSGIGSNRLFRIHFRKPGRMEISHHVGPQLGIMFRLANVRTNTHALLNHDLPLRARLVVDSGPGTLKYYGFLSPFQKHGNVYYSVGNVTAFPRTERNFRAQVEFMEGGDWKFDGGEWKTLAAFWVENPEYTKKRTDSGSTPLTSTNVGNLHATLMSIRLEAPPTNFSHTRPALIAYLRIQKTENGNIVTNWFAQDFVIKDPEGNFLTHCIPMNMNNGAREYALWGTLDPERPWNIRAELARKSGFHSNELFTFRIPFPLTGPIFTNFAGEPAKISFLNQNMLAVSLEAKPPFKRLSFVDAKTVNGQSIAEHGGSWSQHEFWKSVDGQYYEKGEIEATIAIHTNIPVEFVYMPGGDRDKAR